MLIHNVSFHIISCFNSLTFALFEKFTRHKVPFYLLHLPLSFNRTGVTSISRPPRNSPRIAARFLTCREFLLLQTELSQNLQQLSERARSTTEFIQRLKGMTDKVHVSTRAFGVSLKFRVVSPRARRAVRCAVKIAKRCGVNYINSPRDGTPRRLAADSHLR